MLDLIATLLNVRFWPLADSQYLLSSRAVPVLRRGWGSIMSNPASISHHIFGGGDDY